MAKFILGVKQKMTQIFGENGIVMPVTLIKAGPAIVTQIKTKEKDGYEAAQIGFGERNLKNIKKPQKGHLKKAQSLGIKYLKEFRVEKPGFKLGDEITVDVFKEGDKVRVSGVSKGKGFQGVVKRHGFHGGSRTHGQKHSEREPGSIGGGGRAGGRVAKGMRMAGRMGGERVTVRGLAVVDVLPEKNLLLIGGAVPGKRGTILEIRG